MQNHIVVKHKDGSVCEVTEWYWDQLATAMRESCEGADSCVNVVLVGGDRAIIRGSDMTVLCYTTTEGIRKHLEFEDERDDLVYEDDDEDESEAWRHG